MKYNCAWSNIVNWGMEINIKVVVTPVSLLCSKNSAVTSWHQFVCGHKKWSGKERSMKVKNNEYPLKKKCLTPLLDSRWTDNLPVGKTRKFPSLTKRHSPQNEIGEAMCTTVTSPDTLWRSQKINTTWTEEREIRKHPHLCNRWSCASGNCREERRLYKTLKRRRMNWMWNIKSKRERTAITRGKRMH